MPSVGAQMRVLFIAAALAAGLAVAPRPASAGDCSSGGPDVIRDMEAYARGSLKTAPTPDHLCIEQGVMGDAKLEKRFLAACTKILARVPDEFLCVWWPIEMGAKKLGAVDLYDGLHGTPIEPFEYGNLAAHLYVKLDDPRGVAVLREAWAAANADKRATSPKRDHAHNFTVFRHAAITLIGEHGDATDAAFLREQLAKVKDRGLKRAINRALAAIDKRAKPQLPAP